MANDNDAVLMDYLSGLLTPQDPQPDDKPKLANELNIDAKKNTLLAAQPCLQVKLGEQNVLLPLVDLVGMQAICGPLIAVGGVHWQCEKHSNQVLVDLRECLNVSVIPYGLGSWQGHSLKLKQTQQSVLVDVIIGPVHSTGHEKWQSFNGVRYTLVMV
jgi:hypothetical protein